MTEPIAIQQLDKNYNLERYTFCPKHSAKTSDFLGINKDEEGQTHLLFRCKEGHVVYAVPDKSVPQRLEDVAPWMERQRQAVFAEDQGKTKGKG